MASPKPFVDPRATVPAHVLSRLFLLVILVLWLGTNWLAPLDCRSQPMAFSFGSEATGAIVLSPWAAGALGEKPLYNLGDVGTYMLAAVMLAGISFTWWARIHLGRYWSNAITRKEGHNIVDSGPYGLVRHPIYTGLILAILATGAAVATAASLLGALLISFGEWQKARMEERFLSAELGPEAYESYRRRVPMIVPFVRP